jgi:hypothetical protein
MGIYGGSKKISKKAGIIFDLSKIHPKIYPFGGKPKNLGNKEG